MNQEMTKIVRTVLQVFLDAQHTSHRQAIAAAGGSTSSQFLPQVFADRALAGDEKIFSPLRVEEINARVCTRLHRRKHKEQKNTRGYVIAALNALKHSKIIRECTLAYEDTVYEGGFNKSKISFKLTALTILFLVRTRLKLQDAASAVLEDFGVTAPTKAIAAPISPANNPSEALQPSTVSTPQHSGVATLSASRLDPEPTNISPQAIVAALRNQYYPNPRAGTPAAWCGAHGTPGDLLGALHAARAFSAESSVSFGQTLFNPTIGRRLREPLVTFKLLAHREVTEINFNRRKNVPKMSGMFLTPLGRQVAELGAFVDNRDSSALYHRTYKKSEATRPVIAAQARNPQQITVQLPDGTTCTGRIAEVEEFYNRFSGMRAKLAEPEAAPPAETTLGMYETIASFVTDVTRAVAASIERMSHETLPDGTAVQEVSPQYLTFALTQMAYILRDVKHELAEVMCSNGKIDSQRLQDFFAGIELAAEGIANGNSRALPSLRPTRNTTLPLSIKLATDKNIIPEYVGPCPGRVLRPNPEHDALATGVLPELREAVQQRPAAKR